MKLILLHLALLIALSHGRPDDTKFSSKIDSQLIYSMKQEETADIFITFTESTAEVLQSIEDTRWDTRGERLDAMHAALQALAVRVQATTVAYLTNTQFQFQSLWITNQVYVKAATLELIMNLASIPEISSITQEIIIELDAIIEGPVQFGRRQDPEGEWNLKIIQAPEAQALLQSSVTEPAEVIVSTIDTGCRHTHEALRENWVGPAYGWFDPYERIALPEDLNGHGTHTTGTICGKGGIGVYPDAKWTTCRGCYTSSCNQLALLTCAQFIACPTLPDGTEPDCKRAPHVVSNSWGGGRGTTWFDAAIAAFHTGRIIPIFSIGNSGPSCATANSPGDHRDVIGVGATTMEEGLSTFSSVGPAIDGRFKPDVSAPGSNILSAYHTADDAYRTFSGTSMACPHVAGLTSFLFAYNPDLVYGNVTSHIKAGVDTGSLISNGRVCGDGVGDHIFPNHHYGFGRINAFKSLRDLIETSPNP